MYKYFSNELIDKVLFENTLRFTQPEEFNDPFECSPVIKGLSEEYEFEELIDIDKAIGGVVKDWQKNNPFFFGLPESELKEIAYAFLNENKKQLVGETHRRSQLIAKEGIQPALKRTIFETVGVFCLSEKRCEHLMWAHYANNHKGFLIKFDTNNIFFNSPRSVDDVCFRFEKVKYYEERQKHNFISLDKVGLFYEKDVCWKYEEEWRVVKPLATLRQIGKGIFIEKFDWSIVEEIVIGTNCSSDDQIKISNHIKSVAGHIELKQARISSEDYKIIYESL
jgi:hypothetical protein